MQAADEARTTYPSEEQRRVFGERLVEAMADLGLQNKDVGRMCGVGENVVSSWRNGASSPRGRVPWLLCGVLGYERWLRLWGEVEAHEIPGGRLYSEREVDDRARKIAAELLDEQLRTLRQR